MVNISRMPNSNLPIKIFRIDLISANADLEFDKNFRMDIQLRSQCSHLVVSSHVVNFSSSGSFLANRYRMRKKFFMKEINSTK